MEKEIVNKRYKISFIGYGNLAYRMAITLKTNGYTIEYVCGRDLEKANKLAYILNKKEYSTKVSSKTNPSTELIKAAQSDIVILAVSDNAIYDVAQLFYKECNSVDCSPIVLHSSGATNIDRLSPFSKHGVLYPLMTLSSTKPVDFSIIPFLLEANSDEVSATLTNICYSLNSEYRFVDSAERLKIHVAAVFVSNFINYLIGLAFDLSKPNQLFLMPLVIETVRKAFLFQHPSMVQTGPALRKDMETIAKHRALLENNPKHREIYDLFTHHIMNYKDDKESL